MTKNLNLRLGGEHLKLRNLSKISYVWYYCELYLNVLFSFISSYGAALVLEGVGRVEREREGEEAIGYIVHDVRATKLCDWLVKKSPDFLLPHSTHLEQVKSRSMLVKYQYPKIFT